MVYQLKITLLGIKPPIWRRIEVSSETTLEDLHKIIQSAMGWTNSHLHHFMIGNEYYTPPDPSWDDFGNDYTGIKLNELLKRKGQKMKYEYDFGDSWLHELSLEEKKEEEAGVYYPRCTKGKRACPPEDCGGVWGYERLKEIVKDKNHEEHQDMMEWLEEPLEPEEFDMQMVNELLEEKDYGVFSFDF